MEGGLVLAGVSCRTVSPGPDGFGCFVAIILIQVNATNNRGSERDIQALQTLEAELTA